MFDDGSALSFIYCKPRSTRRARRILEIFFTDYWLPITFFFLLLVFCIVFLISGLWLLFLRYSLTPILRYFFLTSGLLFLIYVGIRFISVEISFRKADYNFKEKLFITLNSPKGIAVAVVVATLFIYSVPGAATFIPGIKTLLDLSLIFMIYSILVSSIILKLSKFFLRAKVIKW